MLVTDSHCGTRSTSIPWPLERLGLHLPLFGLSRKPAWQNMMLLVCKQSKHEEATKLWLVCKQNPHNFILFFDGTLP